MQAPTRYAAGHRRRFCTGSVEDGIAHHPSSPVLSGAWRKLEYRPILEIARLKSEFFLENITQHQQQSYKHGQFGTRNTGRDHYIRAPDHPGRGRRPSGCPRKDSTQDGTSQADSSHSNWQALAVPRLLAQRLHRKPATIVWPACLSDTETTCLSLIPAVVTRRFY